jgi:hypothetical protein
MEVGGRVFTAAVAGDGGRGRWQGTVAGDVEEQG